LISEQDDQGKNDCGKGAFGFHLDLFVRLIDCADDSLTGQVAGLFGHRVKTAGVEGVAAQDPS